MMDAARVHDWRIEPREYARHEARRGRRHAFEVIQPARTALVVIDMVAFFVTQNAYCRGIVPNINLLAAGLRSAGGVVAWVVPAAEHAHPALAAEFFGAEVAEVYRRSAGPVWPGMAVAQVDLVVEKRGPSAFFPGACALPGLLRARGIDTVLVAGTVTNVCCESSARDAAGLGFRVVMMADANAAQRDADHNATLHTFYRSFGDVRPTAEVLELLGSGAAPEMGS